MRLLLADDHDLVRDALRCLIVRSAPGCHITGVPTLNAAVEQLLADDGHFDLVMLDIKMPGMIGLQGLQRVMGIVPDTPVALISGVAGHREVMAGIEQGAAGYIPKTLAGDKLISAIRRIASGEVFLPAEFHPAAKTHTELAPTATADIHAELTQREQEVLQYLIDCRSNKEIALALGIQEITVKLHVRSLKRKFGARNRTEIVKLALAAPDTTAA